MAIPIASPIMITTPFFFEGVELSCIEEEATAVFGVAVGEGVGVGVAVGTGVGVGKFCNISGSVS